MVKRLRVNRPGCRTFAELVLVGTLAWWLPTQGMSAPAGPLATYRADELFLEHQNGTNSPAFMPPITGIDFHGSNNMNPGQGRLVAEASAGSVLPDVIFLQGFLRETNPQRDLYWLHQALAVTLTLVVLGSGISLHVYCFNRKLRHEIRERERAEAKFRGLIEQRVVGIYIIQDGRFAYVNPKFAQMFGYAVADIVGRLGLLDLAAQADREQVLEILRHTINGGGGDIRYTFSAVRKDGSLFDIEVRGETHDYEGHPAILGVALDVTEQNRAQRQLSHLAFYDPLTELPNRALFFDRLGQALAYHKRNGGSFALLVLDLDGFKVVNDAYGHKAGDALLMAVGQRLRGCIREADTVARMGGDEFTILLENIQEADNASLVAGKVLATLAEPFLPLGHICQVGASIGICITPRDGSDMEALLSHADVAMYESKARGKNTYTFYQPALTVARPVKMPLLEWNEQLCLGVPVIDEQHAQLVALLNRIDDALKGGWEEEPTMALFDELTILTGDHFATEQRLMEELAYADVIVHEQEHRKLLGDLFSIKRQFDNASLVLTLRALKDWLGRHITYSDRQLAVALLANDKVADPL